MDSVNYHNYYLKELLDKFGDNLIVLNSQVIGICECKGKGKGRCRGLGWAKHKLNSSDEEEPSFSFNKCKYIKSLDNKDD